MKMRILSLISAAAMAITFMTACADKEKSESSAVPGTIFSPQDDDGSKSRSESKDGPVIFIEGTEAKAGEIAEVSVAVKGAENNWQMCGIHVVYDDRLECVASADDPQSPDYVKGEAVFDMTAFVSMIWLENKDDILTERGLGSLFLTTIGENDCGKDGVIATYKFRVPDDAQPGDSYPIGFYYRDGDMFTNAANDPVLQLHAFANMEGGTIKVTE